MLCAIRFPARPTPCRSRPFEGEIQGDDSITARTSDGQEIYVDASVIYQVDPDQVVKVHILWQNRYPDEFVRAQSRGIIRDAVSQLALRKWSPHKRFEMVQNVNQALAEKLNENGLISGRFCSAQHHLLPRICRIRRAEADRRTAGPAGEIYVEQRKQEAQQAVETAKGQADSAVISAEGAAKARLIQAQAEADSLKLIQGASPIILIC